MHVESVTPVDHGPPNVADVESVTPVDHEPSEAADVIEEEKEEEKDAAEAIAGDEDLSMDEILLSPADVVEIEAAPDAMRR